MIIFDRLQLQQMKLIPDIFACTVHPNVLSPLPRQCWHLVSNWSVSDTPCARTNRNFLATLLWLVFFPNSPGHFLSFPSTNKMSSEWISSLSNTFVLFFLVGKNKSIHLVVLIVLLNVFFWSYCLVSVRKKGSVTIIVTEMFHQQNEHCFLYPFWSYPKLNSCFVCLVFLFSWFSAMLRCVIKATVGGRHIKDALGWRRG